MNHISRLGFGETQYRLLGQGPTSFIAVLTFLLLTGCGFHLRGLIHLPPAFKKVSIIQQQVNPALTRTLRLELEANHITPLDPPQKTRYTIILEKDNMEQELINVSASTAPRQYRLLYQLQFQVTRNDGKLILPSQLISVPRQVTINNDRILGSTYELHTIEQEMRQETVTQLLSRLSLQFYTPQP